MRHVSNLKRVQSTRVIISFLIFLLRVLFPCSGLSPPWLTDNRQTLHMMDRLSRVSPFTVLLAGHAVIFTLNGCWLHLSFGRWVCYVIQLLPHHLLVALININIPVSALSSSLTSGFRFEKNLVIVGWDLTLDSWIWWKLRSNLARRSRSWEGEGTPCRWLSSMCKGAEDSFVLPGTSTTTVLYIEYLTMHNVLMTSACHWLTGRHSTNCIISTPCIISKSSLITPWK